MREYWMILLIIFQIFHSLLSKDQTDHHGENKTVTKQQDLLGYWVGGETHLLPCLHQIQWLEEKCGTGAAGVIMVRKKTSATLANQISQYSINLTVWQFSIFHLRDPARKAFVTGLSWETTSIFTSSFLGSFYCISSRSLICIFSIITYRCGG